MSAHSGTLKLDIKKNGLKGVCVQQAHNVEHMACPVRALGGWYIHIHQHCPDPKTFLLSYFVSSGQWDVMDKSISTTLKVAALALDDPSWGFTIERIDTHSLCLGGTNALSLAGYSDQQIQKMSRWKGATFKEYIREELYTFSESMSRDMKQKFKFVNISGGLIMMSRPRCLLFIITAMH